MLSESNFTSSFFEDYSSSNNTKTESSYSNDFYDEYNAFIDELNGTRVDYYNRLQNNEEKRQQEIERKMSKMDVINNKLSNSRIRWNYSSFTCKERNC